MPRTTIYDKRQLQSEIAPFQKPVRWRSIWQLINTLIPFLVLWYVAWQTYEYSVWLSLPVIVLLAGFMVRTFIIFHDCGHRSFFRTQAGNDFWGVLTGVLTYAPYHRWRDSHARHHGTSGNLDKRGQGDVWIMTVEEYRNASRSLRLKYRIYRNPLVMFFLGPIFIGLIGNRWPIKSDTRVDRISIHTTNLAIVALAVPMILLMGWKAYLFIQLTSLFLSHFAGVWLFYVQHNFEGVYWKRNGEWDFVTSALEGGSFYNLPKILRWFTGSIGYHHLHHLNSGIPNYNLARCQDGVESLQEASNPIGFWASLKTISYRLWDEQAERLISFGEARQRFATEA